ncbi:aminodeoxychorismate lyase [Streptomyces sp. SID3343]|uniref:aminotransferase class IV n=1 Tax=Streptomyces sp. SID3343 TaxID=2690260 RepID=UPI00136EF74B|nr:aminodeoxychorismate lyase [Streptomyces sp. SID3343]MYW04323.1 4-amino-4-deoxychorismate lyase [Streptomyces sp. SID3343]
MSKIWLNDRLVDDEQALVRADDHGLTVGDGVFETLKVSGGRTFARTRHLDRLTRSARGLGLPEPDLDLVRRACDEVVRANPLPGLGRLRITHTGGPAPFGSERGEAAPTLLVALGPGKDRGPTTAAVTVPWTRNENAPTAGLKTTSYADNVVMLAHAKERGATEALFANTAGNLCEGTGSNVFVVLDGRVVTPPLSAGCLAGITRELVLEWLGAEEIDVPLSVLADADEVFLTGSLRDVQGVHRIDDRTLTAPGPVTRKAIEVFAARSAADIDP